MTKVSKIAAMPGGGNENCMDPQYSGEIEVRRYTNPEVRVSFEMTIAMTACTLIGVAFLATGIYQRRKVRMSQDWPQTVGSVTDARVLDEPSQDGTNYFVQLQYAYTANGAAYTGKRIGFSRRLYSRKKRALKELERYPLNASVTVYFNPEKPEDAVLVRNYPESVVLLGGGILFLALVVVAMVWGRK